MHQKSNVLELASYINMENVPDSWQKAMEKIENQIPKQIEWLNIKTAQEVLDFYEIKEENFRKQYLEAIAMICQDEILKTIVYLWHYILYKDEFTIIFPSGSMIFSLIMSSVNLNNTLLLLSLIFA